MENMIATMANPTDIFAGIPADLPQELVQTLLAAPGLRIERIVSHGHASPKDFWYDQEMHEWVLLIQGAARLQFLDGRSMTMTPGSFVNIPAHTQHRVEWTDAAQATIWLAIHYQDAPPV